MTEETKIEAKAAVDATAKVAQVAQTVADNVETIAKENAKAAKRNTKAAKRPRTATARKTKRVAQKAASRRSASTGRKPRATTGKPTTRKSTTRKSAARNSAAAATKRIETMTNNYFNGFDAVPAFAPFQNMFAQAGDRSQDVAKRGQKVAEELADLARSNVEAMVEASRVAAEGTRAIGQEAVSKGRDGFAQAADAIRSLAEAKSPTEYLQLQGEFARASFDRAVAESSRLTESLVKLAGEAFQPLSNRASANAERFNTLVA